MRWLAAILVGATFLALAAPAPADELYKSVRALQSLQDAMVGGDANAQKVRMKLLATIAREAASGSLKPGEGLRNQRAAIVYILSGGAPEAGSAMLKSGGMAPELASLLEGAIAYAEGDKGRAAELLLGADLADMPESLAGPVHLIRASLRKQGDLEGMRNDLAKARALLPGTLIEESALRRSVAIEAEARNLDRFEAASSAYFRRFPKSIYAGQFAFSFVRFTASLGYETASERLHGLETLINTLPRDKAVFVFLELAQQSLLRGNVALASFSVERARGLTESASAEEARSQLYLAALLITGDLEEQERGREILGEIDDALLSRPDKDLRRAVSRLSDGIRAEVMPMIGPNPPPNADNAIAARVDGVLKAADEALAVTQ